MSCNVLHICGGFQYSNLYTELISHLNNENVNSQIIAPIFENLPTDAEKIGNSKIYYFHRNKNKFSRFLFLKKIRNIIDFIEKNISLSEIDVIHAHSWFSDGLVAYYLSIKYNIPYIVAIRNTDLNIFYKFFIHLRQLSIKILNNAEKIIFISPAYKKKTEILISKKNPILKNKFQVIPNGINEFWLKNRHYKQKIKATNINLLYIGDFCRFKNIHTIIKACDKLNKEGYKIAFTAVGKNSKHSEKNYQRYIEKLEKKKSFFKTENRKNKEELLDIFKENDIFIMLSKYETFGLVYAEALSQGLPVIYTQNQGFDGFFQNGEVGYATCHSNLEIICQSIKRTIENYDLITDNISKNNLNMFNWNEIAKNYLTIYNSIKK